MDWYLLGISIIFCIGSIVFIIWIFMYTIEKQRLKELKKKTLIDIKQNKDWVTIEDLHDLIHSCCNVDFVYISNRKTRGEIFIIICGELSIEQIENLKQDVSKNIPCAIVPIFCFYRNGYELLLSDQWELKEVESGK